MFVTRGWWYSFLPRINFFTSVTEKSQLWYRNQPKGLVLCTPRLKECGVDKTALGRMQEQQKTAADTPSCPLTHTPPPPPPPDRMKCRKCRWHFILDRLCFRLPSELSSITHNGCSSHPVSGLAAGCPPEQITGKFNTNYNNFRYTWSCFYSVEHPDPVDPPLIGLPHGNSELRIRFLKGTVAPD